MDRTTLFQEQAAYCAYLLRRAMTPDRRALIEQERQDWLMLAYQHRLWSEIKEPSSGDAPSPANAPANAPARAYAAPRQALEL